MCIRTREVKDIHFLRYKFPEPHVVSASACMKSVPNVRSDPAHLYMMIIAQKAPAGIQLGD